MIVRCSATANSCCRCNVSPLHHCGFVHFPLLISDRATSRKTPEGSSPRASLQHKRTASLWCCHISPPLVRKMMQCSCYTHHVSIFDTLAKLWRFCKQQILYGNSCQTATPSQFPVPKAREIFHSILSGNDLHEPKWPMCDTIFPRKDYSACWLLWQRYFC